MSLFYGTVYELSASERAKGLRFSDLPVAEQQRRIETRERERRNKVAAEAKLEQLRQNAKAASDAPRVLYGADNKPLATKTDEAWGRVDWNAVDAPREFLVDGVIQEGTVNLFFGDPDSLKSWTAYSIAEAVHTGKPWLGHATKKGLVCLLDYEGGLHDVSRRMRILKKLPPDAPLPDLAGMLYRNPEWLLNNQDLYNQLANLKPALVVIDSLTRGQVGGDMKESTYATALDYAKRLIRDIGCTVIIIAHKNKSGKEGQASVAGTFAIFAATEGAFEFLGYEYSPGNISRVTMHCARQKEGQRCPDIKLELSDEKGLIEVTSKAFPDAKETTVDGVKAKIRLHVSNNPDQCENQILRNIGCTREPLRKRAKAALTEMVQSGELETVRRTKGHVYRLARTGPLPPNKVEEVIALVRHGVTEPKTLAKAANLDELELLEIVKTGKLEMAYDTYTLPRAV